MLKRLFSFVFVCFALIFGTLSVASAYTVTYDCGDGTGSAPETQIATSGESFTPATNTCTAPNADGNHHFSGWMVDGTDDVIPAGAPMTWTYGTDKTLTAQYTPGKFSVTTTDLSDSIAQNGFKFLMSASGIFTVNCGTGGTLSGSGVDGNTIDRTSNTNENIYTCTWNTGGVKTITFDGTADGYATFYNSVGTDPTATIRFYGKIKSINGILSNLFPFLGNSATRYPAFSHTFYECRDLTSIPPELFAGFTEAGAYMFNNTFENCTGLKSIPSELFANFTISASGMFYYTFNNCIGLTSIPKELFSSFTTGASSMFGYTFRYCTGLTSIPKELFSSFRNGAYRMFDSTFSGCSGLKSLPSELFASFTTGAKYMFNKTFWGAGLISLPPDLFAGFTTGADHMFDSTFSSCNGLKSLPSGLFASFTTGADYMFDSTFSSCSGLKSLPSELFASFTTGADYMFKSTFHNCSSLISLQPDLFAGFTTGATRMFNGTFYGCTGLTSIPKELFSSFTTGAEGMFAITFNFCSRLTSIPPELFSSFTTGADNMFSYTFSSCTKLRGYVPKDLFKGLIVNHVSPSTNMFLGTFDGTGLSTSCGTGMQQAWTGTDEWDTYVAYRDSPWNTGAVKVSCEYIPYDVTYDCGVGTGTVPDATSIQYTISFTPAENTCTPPTDYAFNGWLISGTNNVVQPNNSFTWKYTENKTLTAQWRSTLVNLNWFDGDEELTVNSEAQMCRYGTVISFPTNEMKKTGYHFLGWIGKGE